LRRIETRFTMHSSRFDVKIARNFARSTSGVGSWHVKTRQTHPGGLSPPDCIGPFI
jgi:hypothetical protein